MEEIALPSQYIIYAGIIGFVMLIWKNLKTILDGLFDSWKQSIEVKKSKLDLQIQEAQFWKQNIDEIRIENSAQIKELVEYINYIAPHLPPKIKSFNEWKYDRSVDESKE